MSSRPGAPPRPGPRRPRGPAPLPPLGLGARLPLGVLIPGWREARGRARAPREGDRAVGTNGLAADGFPPPRAPPRTRAPAGVGHGRPADVLRDRLVLEEEVEDDPGGCERASAPWPCVADPATVAWGPWGGWVPGLGPGGPGVPGWCWSRRSRTTPEGVAAETCTALAGGEEGHLEVGERGRGLIDGEHGPVQHGDNDLHHVGQVSVLPEAGSPRDLRATAAPGADEPALRRRRWPFLIGFGVTGALYLNVALGVTDEDVKKSKFTNPYQH